MKKVILLATAVMVFGFTNAQDVKFGAKVALNVASLTGDVDNASSLIGFQIGGFAEIKISEKFAIQPELMYSAQGVKENILGEEFTTKLGYINIPVMAKYYVAKSFSLEAGPQIGFLTSAITKAEENGVSVEVDVKDYTSSVDFGFNFGAGYDFTEKLFGGLRYNLGLSNVSDVPYDDSSAKNSVFSVSLGYKF